MQTYPWRSGDVGGTNNKRVCHSQLNVPNTNVLGSAHRPALRGYKNRALCVIWPWFTHTNCAFIAFQTQTHISYFHMESWCSLASNLESSVWPDCVMDNIAAVCVCVCVCVWITMS